MNHSSAFALLSSAILVCCLLRLEDLGVDEMQAGKYTRLNLDPAQVPDLEIWIWTEGRECEVSMLAGGI